MTVSRRMSCTGIPVRPFRVWDVFTWITSSLRKMYFFPLYGSVYQYQTLPAPAKIPASSTSTCTQFDGMIHRFLIS